MPTTYTPLYTTTLGNDVPTVSISGFGSAYTDLVLIISGYSSSDGAVPWLQFNGDTTTNYSQTFVSGNGSTARSDRNTNLTSLWTSYSPGFSTTSTNISNVIINIQNYANTTTSKTVLCRMNAPAGTYAGTSASVGLWRKTPEAITSILVGITAGNFKAGTTFSLYGIASTSALATTKATGGDSIVTSGGYTYHVFRSSGTFTPTQSISADIFCVAGGGGGGGGAQYWGGGGGGAGGVLAFASQSLTAQGYTVTIGAGGSASTTSDFSANTPGSNSQFGSLTPSYGGGTGGSVNGPGASGTFGSTGGVTGTGTPRTPTSGQGFIGGTNAGGNIGAGGGGAGGAGQGVSGNPSGGAGGVGVNTYVNATWLATGLAATLTGVNGYIAGGGAGGASPYYGTPTQAIGGAGGGGNGGTTAGTGSTSGVVNTGSGGGGSAGTNASAPPNGVGGAGGSGIVIVRYAV